MRLFIVNIIAILLSFSASANGKIAKESSFYASQNTHHYHHVYSSSQSVVRDFVVEPHYLLENEVEDDEDEKNGHSSASGSYSALNSYHFYDLSLINSHYLKGLTQHHLNKLYLLFEVFRI
ncbi:MAG: hypothetical protein H6582_08500 [Crocinitomicaceae bacterium]|nr:hypothetical protein [Crocinitomicaceae bacterium]